jgi:hypothetical protein
MPDTTFSSVGAATTSSGAKRVPARLVGGGGADRLFGGAGNDRLIPGAGEDVAKGSAGDDTFRARDGERDRLNGQPGHDRARIDRRLDSPPLLSPSSKASSCHAAYLCRDLDRRVRRMR